MEGVERIKRRFFIRPEQMERIEGEFKPIFLKFRVLIFPLADSKRWMMST